MKYIFSITYDYFPSLSGWSIFQPVDSIWKPKIFSIHNLNNTSLKKDKLANLFGGSMMDEVA